VPSGKTHDAVTFLLVAPTFAGIVTFGFLIGGLMFGPDLDTMSKQYTRWSIFRFLWYPYQAFFKHRSRWSHGLIFGTLLRVIYFMGVLTLLAFGIVYIFESYTGGNLPNLFEMTKTWGVIGNYVRVNIGEYVLPSLFAGLWLGAASHTLTDMAGSFIKHGRIMEFL
jgi:uncharacterized metal-binding protein